MIPANDINQRIQEIKDYVAVAKLKEAIKRLIDLTRDFSPTLENDAIIISSSNYNITKSEVRGLIGPTKAKREKNSIALNILQILPLIPKNHSHVIFAPSTSPNVHTPNPSIDYPNPLSSTKEQLAQRAAGILEVLQRQPERGADLLIDFIKQYATNPKLENEAILAKLQWMMEAEEVDKAAALQQLKAKTQQMINDYNPAVLNEIRAKEAALAERLKALPLPNALVLQASGLRKSYARNKFSLELDKLELRLGEITGLVGKNAIGKTTLLRILAGELGVDAGEIRYPLFSTQAKPFWPQIKTRIAYVPQELSPWLGSLSENLSLEAVQHGLKGDENQKAVKYIVQRLGLDPHLDKTWAELSGGYKLRFALAKALIWNPQLLIIDEPLAYLDVKTQLILLNDLKNLSRGLQYPLAVLISSQHLHEIEAVADQMLFMYNLLPHLRGQSIEKVTDQMLFDRNVKVEYLGHRQDWGKNRKVNVFEFGSTLNSSALTSALEGLAYNRLWHNGLNWLLSTNLNISSEDFLQFLNQKQIRITYFRDISSSVKTRFYDEFI